ncbi:TPSNR protein, partial [Amia calva]|nr:TPSNR protein [Amia calva]
MSVAMVVLTRTPTVDSALLRDVRLDCGFAVDHTRPEVTVEWRVQHRGERLKLFSYASRTGRPETQTPGAAVSLKDIQRGNASLRLTGVQVKSEGTYVCSVYVPPLYGSHDVQLRILESPRVSLNVGTTLELQEEADQKVVCEITGYYPLDVEVEWLRETSGVRMLPTLLKNILYTSHRHNADGTFSISAFFLLRANLPDHGSRYTCRVSHVSLRTPIRKSFTLSVSGQHSHIGMLTFFVLLENVWESKYYTKSEFVCTSES